MPHSASEADDWRAAGRTERYNLSTADPFWTIALSSLPSSPATLATSTASEWVVSKLRACKCCYWTVLIHALHALCTRAECGASVRWHSVIATVCIRLTGLRYSYGDSAKFMLLRLPAYISWSFISLSSWRSTFFRFCVPSTTKCGQEQQLLLAPEAHPLTQFVYHICKTRVFVKVRHLNLCASVNVGAVATAF